MITSKTPRTLKYRTGRTVRIKTVRRLVNPCLECETVHQVHFIFWLGSVKRILFNQLSILQAAACLIHNFDLDYDELQRILAFSINFSK